jgi:tetratricopeptide (TPR) repeat protein
MGFSTRGTRFLQLWLSLAAILTPVLLHAQAAPAGRVVLVLPFENRSGNASLNWVGDSFPDTLDKRLNSAGFLTISHDDRAFAYNHLGLPEDFKPSRATTIRIAEQLDANFVVIGSFTTAPNPGSNPGTAGSGDRIVIQSQVLSVDDLKLSPPVDDSAELNRLFDAENAIAWKVARVIDPHLNISEQTFLAAAGAVPLSAFEDYIRGITAPSAAERLQRLHNAVALQPTYAAAVLALGKEQYTARDFASAAATLAKVPASSPLALEANFYIGLANFNTNNYAGAENAFAFVAARLPLPEVLNNEAVAMSRQGKDAVVLFQKASAADPNDEDYHYNLAIALFRRGDTAAALREADAALKLRPNDPDAGELRARLSITTPGTRLADVPDTSFTPVERIRRTYSETSFRQAEFQLNELRDARLAMLPPDQRADEYVAAGRQYISEGLLPQAEQQFQSALSADPSSASAHAALGQVRELSGDATGARSEAQASLALKPNVPAYLLLARLDMAANQLAAAGEDVSHALQIEPNNPAAIALRLSLQEHGQAAH